MLLLNFNRQLNDFFKLQPGKDKLLLAVSGGLDSVVLADLVAKSGFDFAIAHCNFQLRGAESERDEMFVKLLGENYNKEVFVKKIATEAYAEAFKLSVQEAARQTRYEWFEQLLKKGIAGQLATAHHANDNIETTLMHFFRGTGLRGLTGIPEEDKERNIIRPLLFAKREAILAYAQTHALPWVEDSSNASEKYTRNFFRLNIFPAVKEVYSNAEDNILNSVQLFQEAEILFNQAIEVHKKKLLEKKGNEIHIPVLKLKQSEPLQTIIWEIIRYFGFTPGQTAEVIKLMNADNGSYIGSASHRIIKNRAWIIIAPNETVAASTILIERNEPLIVFENGTLKIEDLKKITRKPEQNNFVATVDMEYIKFPLLLRKWKQGDYFYPLGMNKKKKLSKFFIDNKLSKTDKEKCWVIESDKKIIWVVGQRIDDRFKVTDKSNQLLRIVFTPHA
ncbi:MAG TPA: tRNA lysidine(34) synthetase TilS [Panacibacter sp.]|nr:tRNA lysidine(34) synthetase TilS [Panacibacter sp.]HNP45170.1 tRNA lysidine(34) synthetase TilS [Panacibacter sp.]